MSSLPSRPTARWASVLLLLAFAGCGWLGTDTRWGEGYYKVGRPYQINGRWYYPAYDPNYERVGTASWYGEAFDGLETANGEVFDMDELSAAHPTLPLPSVVRVTNLANGRSLDVRVNDRGPFVEDRLIDVSQAAARRLGFEQAGLTPVRVKFLGLADARGTPPASPTMVASRENDLLPPVRMPLPPRRQPPQVVAPLPPATPAPPVVVAQLPPAAPATSTQAPQARGPRHLVRPPLLADVAPEPEPWAPPPPAPPAAARPAVQGFCASGPQYVQVGAFSDSVRVQAAMVTLRSLERVVIEPYFANGQALARVKLGPLPGYQAASAMVDRVRGLGYPEAFVLPAAGSTAATAC
jgi:rare lipoprotein A